MIVSKMNKLRYKIRTGDEKINYMQKFNNMRNKITNDGKYDT